MQNKNPFAYFITIRTYKTWLHGDARGSVDLKNNTYGEEKISSMPALLNYMQYCAKETPLLFDEQHRNTMLNSILETAKYNAWYLFAAHVRTNHIHIVIRGDISAEKMMGKIKCFGTKALKGHHSELKNRENFWTRHGSTVNIWSAEKLFPTLYYVVKKQGKPMALYYDKKQPR